MSQQARYPAGRAGPAATPVGWPGVIRQYCDRLPADASGPVVTLGEGATPLLPAPVVSARTGCEVYLKVEGANPTGSFKDRGMTVAVSMAMARGATAVICASTGNTSASAAAYAARAGLTCAVLVPRGKIALGVTERLGFLQRVGETGAGGVHPVQDVVGGAVDDSQHLPHRVAGQ